MRYLQNLRAIHSYGDVGKIAFLHERRLMAGAPQRRCLRTCAGVPPQFSMHGRELMDAHNMMMNTARSTAPPESDIVMLNKMY